MFVLCNQIFFNGNISALLPNEECMNLSWYVFLLHTCTSHLLSGPYKISLSMFSVISCAVVYKDLFSFLSRQVHNEEINFTCECPCYLCSIRKSVHSLKVSTWHGDTFGKYIQGCVLGFLYILQVVLHLWCFEYRHVYM